LVDAGVGIAHGAYRYLLQHFVGLRPELGDGAEAAFESVVREQLGEGALPAVTGVDPVGRSAPSQRFDAKQAARAAVYQVEFHGWDKSSDLARALYRLLFAGVRIDPQALAARTAEASGADTGEMPESVEGDDTAASAVGIARVARRASRGV